MTEGALRARDGRIGRVWRYARWPVYAGLALFLAVVCGFVILYLTVDLPAAAPLRESSIVLDAKGREIASLSREGLRVEVSLDQVAPPVADALLASEDRRFYEHGGVDPIGIGRAVINNVFDDDVEGASTITQQLVRNQYLDTDRTLGRKVREAVLAVKLDNRDDKDEILERYLNTVYFGRGAYGIEAAARVYFDRPAAALAVHEAALLVGLLRAPEAADPSEDPATATARRDEVLDDMVATGSLSDREAASARHLPLGAVARSHPVTLTAGVAPHFVEWIRQQAVAEFGEERVYGGGLRIHTTLDLDDQVAAEQAIAAVLTEPGDPQASLIALDADGAIRAHVGGRDFGALQVDLARGADGGGTGRQPGSAFKPFVLAAALEDGIPLGAPYAGPASITLPTDEGPWIVENYGGEEYGTVGLLDATARSVNTVYAQLIVEVGPDAVVDVADRTGLDAEMEAHPSLALGTEEVAPVDLAGAFLTFARDGQRFEPHAVIRVDTADGDVLSDRDAAEPASAVPTDVARTVNHALQEVVERGTGESANLDRPVAGKTGTTQNYGDAWFAGYTPNFAAVVWMGYPEGPEHAMTDVHGRSVTGGSFPAEIWRRFAEVALADVPVEEFPAPPDELLATPDMTAQLSVKPSEGDPGVPVTASGDGFRLCAVQWHVTFEPRDVTPFEDRVPTQVHTAPESGSTGDERTTTFAVPANSAPGTYAVTAWCDSGAGTQAVAEATFTVLGAPPPTTTTTVPGTTTTRPRPPRTTTTTTTTSTTTTTEPTTTTTEKPP